jgi:hypothetical protein
MSYPFRLGFVVLGLFLLSSSEARADSMRCGNRLVSSGDTEYEVQATCGAPDSVRQRVLRQVVYYSVPAPCRDPKARAACFAQVPTEVVRIVDEWTYDFGRNRFIQIASFEDGRLESVATAGYGAKEPG